VQRYLLCVRRDPRVLLRGFDFDDATGRKLALERLAHWRFLGTVGSEQAAVRQARATVREIDDAADARLELGPDFVQQIDRAG
jgi:hypothetical protein